MKLVHCWQKLIDMNIKDLSPLCAGAEYSDYCKIHFLIAIQQSIKQLANDGFGYDEESESGIIFTLGSIPFYLSVRRC